MRTPPKYHVGDVLCRTDTNISSEIKEIKMFQHFNKHAELCYVVEKPLNFMAIWYDCYISVSLVDNDENFHVEKRDE